MTKDSEGEALAGLLIDEHTEMTLDELMLFCSVRRETIVALVQEGILEPKGENTTQWRFGGDSLRRAAKAVRLQRDLDIDVPAAALVLDLLEEIENLRMQLQALARE
jgi:chaperone modulatory protein CbpM